MTRLFLRGSGIEDMLLLSGILQEVPTKCIFNVGFSGLVIAVIISILVRDYITTSADGIQVIYYRESDGF